MTTSIGRNSGSTATPTKATFSYWLKGKEDGTAQGIWGWHRGNDAGNYWLGVYYSTNGSMYFNWKQGSFTCTLGTTQKFRDPSAWGHHVISIDTTLGTASDRVKWYINGERVTSFEDGLDTITQNSTLLNWSNAQDKIEIGTWYQASTAKNLNNHLLSHFHFTDGYAYQASDFGSTDSTSGQWKINTSPSVTYGNEGFFILKDGNTITDSSTNSNNFSLDGGTLTKTEDCPDNNFATMNVLGFTSAGLDIRNGNTHIFNDDNNNAFNTVYSTLGMTTGKYYWEIKCVGVWGSGSQMHGIGDLGSNAIQTATGQATDTNQAYGWRNNGSIQRGATTVAGTSWASSFTTGDILAFAFDATNKKLYLKKNDVWLNSGDPTSGATGTGALSIVGDFDWGAISETKYGSDKPAYNYGNGYFVTTAVATAGTNASGNGIFEYDVPTGYTALSTKGLNL